MPERKPIVSAVVRRLLYRTASALRLSHEWHVLALAAVIGIVVGGLALGFIESINALLRTVSAYAQGSSTAFWVALGLPIVGAAVTVLVFRLIPSTFRGHGISRVLLAVHRQRSVIPLSLAPRQWIASSATIVSGGSAGPEGPIVAIGSAVGSALARWLGLDASRRTTLLGCGAAAGLAAVFDAPIAGVFFVLEVILRDFTPRTFTPIVIAAVTASATAQSLLHSTQPPFGIGPGLFNDAPLTLVHLPLFSLLGVLTGVAAAGFGLWMKAAHRTFDSLPIRSSLRPLVGAVALVGLGAATATLSETAMWRVVAPASSTPPFYGTGYGLIGHLLEASPESLAGLGIMGALLAWALLKVVATALTLGSGSAGGLFAPGLVVGALLGAAFSALTNAIPALPDVSPAAAILVGMGSFVAAGAHAPLAGAFLVYELSHSYTVLLPLLLAAVLATVTARLVHRESIYTAELAAFNIRLGTIADHSIMRRTAVSDIRLTEAVTVRPTDSAQHLVDLGERQSVHDFPVIDAHGRYRGFVSGSDVRQALVYRDALKLLTVSELERTDFNPLEPDDTLDTAMERFGRHETPVLPVVDPVSQQVLGLLSRSHLLKVYQSALEET